MTDADSSFRQEVINATPGGESLVTCMQCGTCGGSCPSADDMDHTPLHAFAMIEAGMRDEFLRSNTPWYCVSRYYCTERCPKENPITDLMYPLKRISIRERLDDDRHAPNGRRASSGWWRATAAASSSAWGC